MLGGSWALEGQGRGYTGSRACRGARISAGGWGTLLAPWPPRSACAGPGICVTWTPPTQGGLRSSEVQGQRVVPSWPHSAASHQAILLCQGLTLRAGACWPHSVSTLVSCLIPHQPLPALASVWGPFACPSPLVQRWEPDGRRLHGVPSVSIPGRGRPAKLPHGSWTWDTRQAGLQPAQCTRRLLLPGRRQARPPAREPRLRWSWRGPQLSGPRLRSLELDRPPSLTASPSPPAAVHRCHQQQAG